jgi:hypothetical protein
MRLAPVLLIEDEAAALWSAATGAPAGLSQQLSAETTGETRAAEAAWQATVRNDADVVLTHEGPLLQVLALAIVIGQFWPALRVCVRRQQHRAPRPECAA